MNLGAFAIVAFIRNQFGTEDLSGYRGLVQKSPVMTVLFSVFLLSLLGIPPLAGFAAKFQIFSVLFDAGKNYYADQPRLGFVMYALLVIGGINTVISAVYYLTVLKDMILDKPDEEPADRQAPPMKQSAGSSFYGTVLAVLVFVVFLAWQPLGKASDRGVNRFQRLPPAVRLAGERMP
jgi:NADH-quinone oxidoreductase subunit N